MKKLIVLFSSLLVVSTSFGATVQSAKIVGDQLIVTVRHSGGCGTHTYDLDLQGCAETFPVQCQSKIIHRSDDACEALITRQAKFSLKKLGLTESYYSNGSLEINGSQGSSATVQLPGAQSSATGIINCVTHTRSKLKIDAKKKLVTLTAVDGRVAKYTITKVKSMSLESHPPIEQTTYSLDDGRKIIVNFRGQEIEGDANFVRVNGEYSPDFACQK